MSDYGARIARLQEILRERGVKLALLSWTDQMRYLTGYVEGGHKRLLSLWVPAQGEPAFLVPALHEQAAGGNPAGVKRVLTWDDTTGWHPGARALLEEYGVQDGDTALIDDELYSVHLLGLLSLRPGLRCLPADETLVLLRGLKTPQELEALQHAADLIDAVVEEGIAAMREGMTERELQDEIHAAFKRRNTRAAFTPLICFGANGAMPHHHSGEARLQQGDMVVIDIGCVWDDYLSDITRTVSFGPPSDPDAEAVYDVVSRAHWAGREAVRPGVACETVDAAARKVIVEAGYGAQFIHRTGHGIGLSGHEPPYILAGNKTPLAPGMCFSVEPGIYLPGRFGVRIENIVAVAPDGVRSLNVDPPKTLRIVPPVK